MYFVYAIASLSRNYIYVGLTADVARGCLEHQRGYNKTTRLYSPFKLIYSEPCADRATARQREKYWKSGIGKERLRAIRDETAKR